MQGLTDKLVGDVRAVEIAGIDMVYAVRNGLAENRQRRAMILGRTEYAGACELHSAIAEPVHGVITKLISFRFVDIGHD